MNDWTDGTGSLLPRDGFLVGAGSIFDFAGDYYSYRPSKGGWEADAKALASDWTVIGDDMYAIVEQVFEEADHE